MHVLFFRFVVAHLRQKPISLMLLLKAAFKDAVAGFEPLTLWLCDCLSNQFPLHHYDSQKLSNFRALTLDMML